MVRKMKRGPEVMKTKQRQIFVVATLTFVFAFTATVARAQDPLPSWNDVASKKAIIAFVNKVTKAGSPDFVPPAERIATFDNDGTLWAEQPMYFQLLFALHRVGVLAPQHPEWKRPNRLPAAQGDKALAGGEKSTLEIIMATRRDVHRGIREDRQGLDRNCKASSDQAALH
jgi:hypothetical protein